MERFHFQNGDAMRMWLKNVVVIMKGTSRIGIFLVAEHALPALRLYSAAEYIVSRYYDRLSWRVDQRDLALARIYEKSGKIDRAEESVRRAIALRPSEPDNYLFLGQCFARWRRPLDAIRAFEQAINTGNGSTRDVEFARRRIEELRAM
jgi:tetratricopeptide (TPR) repeat protein